MIIYIYRILVIDCGVPPQPEHGKVIGSGHMFNDSVMFVCDDGYQLNGNISSICSESGFWTRPIPTCTLIGTFMYTVTFNSKLGFYADSVMQGY